MRRTCLLIAATGLLAGCATGGYSGPFTRQWTNQLRHESELKARQEHMKRINTLEPHGAVPPKLVRPPREDRGISFGDKSGFGGYVDDDEGVIHYRIRW